MRFIATMLLVLMTAVFVVASAATKHYPWAAYVRAFAEAGMVGACADWFAVVSLFRRPFGLPIPHTAIIPRNKQRIGDALGRFITNNFLSRSIMAERLDRVDVMRWSAGWLRDRRHGKKVGRQLRVILPKIVNVLPKEQAVDLFAQISCVGLEAIPAAPVASKVLAILWAQGETQLLIDRAIVLAQASLLKRQGLIRQKIAEKSSRLVPKWVDGKLADNVIDGLLATFEDMRSPKHPWRADLRVAVEKLISRLADDPAFYERGEQIKFDILKNRLVRDQIHRLCQDFESTIASGVATRPTAITTSVELAFAAIGQWLDENEAIQTQINLVLRRAAVQLLLPRRAAIGEFISQVVSDWDTSTLIDKLELQIGKDLQYIRINGTLVGGAAGLVIFSVSRWFGSN
ncbi:MAG: DUF445 domain-containing protein [Beijerinckiaceae bacterium]|nr:DUF445 domain-containing protein [Beijerinckiaceae bacterium]